MNLIDIQKTIDKLSMLDGFSIMAWIDKHGRSCQRIEYKVAGRQHALIIKTKIKQEAI